MAITLTKKIVFITGASSGIGKATAQHFAKLGANLILTARRIDKVEQLANELQTQYSISTLPIQLDVRDKQVVITTITNLPTQWRDIDILINNAGLALGSVPIQQSSLDDWDTMIATNIQGLLYVTQQILPTMIARNSGHIINIGSIAGRDCYPGGNIYCATKHAVNALSKSMRLDLLGTQIRVTEIAPGAVHTEFSEVRWQDKQKSDQYYAQFTPLLADDIADAIVYCATRPLHVNVSELIVFPTDQASCHHINKTT